jgi:hypothetical protein
MVRRAASGPGLCLLYGVPVEASIAMLPEPEAEDDDTIEIELTAEEMRGLSRAANEAQPPTYAVPARRRRFRLWPWAIAAIAVVGVATAIIWRRAPHRVAPQVAAASLPAVKVTPPAASEPAVPATPPDPPVRVRNPFDATEVFEFPAGTTKAEARQKIAEALLQRAVDRRSQAQDRRRARRRRAQDD